MNLFFFNLCSDLFSIIAKKANQIKNNVVCIIACLVFMFCCALNTGGCNAFQQVFVNQKKKKKIGVLRPNFPDYVISCDYV